MAINPGLIDIFRIGLRSIIAYRMWLYLGVFQIVLQLVLLRAIWTAVYDGREAVGGVSAATMVTYLSVVLLLQQMMRFDVSVEILQRIDEGRIAVDLLRPVGFIWQMMALNLGTSAAAWLTLVVVVPVFLAVGSLALPASGVIAPLVASVVLAYVVSTLLWLIVGLSGFWLLEVSGLRAMVNVASGLLAGTLVPLWFMPWPLRAVVELLPFQAMAYLPASIWVEQAEGGAVWRALGIQALWVVLLGAASVEMWRRAQRRLVVQGG